ncbi:hypothetical protein ASD86_14905 [Lysobacter sp. Root690]|nr:hypothetical protein ASD86_14905 [Lysobacter sp. Root690]
MQADTNTACRAYSPRCAATGPMRAPVPRFNRREENSVFAATLASQTRSRECIEAIIDQAGIAAGAAPVRGSVAITQDASA